MCYNTKCTIEIRSCIDGSAVVARTEGRVAKTPDCTRFDYSLDGDECTLTINSDKVVQVRRGKQNIKMTFKKNSESECFLGSDGFSGAFTVFTRDLTFFDRARDLPDGNRAVIAALSLSYSLGEQQTELDFSARYIAKVKK